MKLSNLFLLLVLFNCLLVSCTQDDDFLMQKNNEIDIERKKIGKDELTLKQKLLLIKNNGEHIITRSLYANNSQLQLKESKNIGIISSVNELEQLKSDILSDDSCFPYYDVENNCISLLSWSEIEARNENNLIQYSKSDLEVFLNTVLNIGMNKLELIWQCNSKTYKTICVTSGDDIIYDNIIMNILCISKEARLDDDLLPMLKTRNPEGNTSRSYTNNLGCTAYWLWGSERGRVDIYHTIYGNSESLDNSTCSEYSYISIGSAGAEAQIKECKKGTGGYSICNYAYYLATPTVSVTISGGNGIDFSVSVSGIGSQGSGSGNDYLSCSNL